MPNPDSTIRYLVRKKISSFMYLNGFRFLPVTKKAKEDYLGPKRWKYKLWVTTTDNKISVNIELKLDKFDQQ